MKKRNTKQKEIIMNILENDRSHPTIYELYEKVNKVDKTIGQATIYRHVNNLLKDGEIQKIKISDHNDRYDVDTSIHLHFLCNSCNKIYDFFDADIAHLITKIGDKNSISINNCSIIIEGKCNKCIKGSG